MEQGTITFAQCREFCLGIQAAVHELRDNTIGLQKTVEAHTLSLTELVEDFRRHKTLEEPLTVRWAAWLDDIEAHKEHEAEDRKALCRIEKDIASLLRSFPEGNGAAHRMAHEAMIQEARDRKDFVLSVKKGATTSLLVSFIILLASAVLFALSQGWRG